MDPIAAKYIALELPAIEWAAAASAWAPFSATTSPPRCATPPPPRAVSAPHLRFAVTEALGIFSLLIALLLLFAL